MNVTANIITTSASFRAIKSTMTVSIFRLCTNWVETSAVSLSCSTKGHLFNATHRWSNTFVHSVPDFVCLISATIARKSALIQSFDFVAASWTIYHVRPPPHILICNDVQHYTGAGREEEGRRRLGQWYAINDWDNRYVATANDIDIDYENKTLCVTLISSVCSSGHFSNSVGPYSPYFSHHWSNVVEIHTLLLDGSVRTPEKIIIFLQHINFIINIVFLPLSDRINMSSALSRLHSDPVFLCSSIRPLEARLQPSICWPLHWLLPRMGA